MSSNDADKLPSLTDTKFIDLTNPTYWPKQAEELEADIEFQDRVRHLINVMLRHKPNLLISYKDMKWLLNSIIVASHETGGEADVRRFVDLFEWMGFEFKYTTSSGWEVITFKDEESRFNKPKVEA